MWNKIKLFFRWIGFKLGIVKQLKPPAVWPYADEHSEKKIVYIFTGKTGLESRMSRKFRKDD